MATIPPTPTGAPCTSPEHFGTVLAGRPCAACGGTVTIVLTGPDAPDSEVAEFLSRRPYYDADHVLAIGLTARRGGVPFCLDCGDWHVEGDVHSIPWSAEQVAALVDDLRDLDRKAL